MMAMDIDILDSVETPSPSPSRSISTGGSSRPIPFAVLKVQFKRLVEQHQERNNNRPGVIATKDLLMVIDAYEQEHDVILLTPLQKKAIQPYTLTTPDLEMTPDDILNLLKLVFAPSPTASVSAPTSKLSTLPRTSAPLKPNSSTTWKRRLSTASMNATQTITTDYDHSTMMDTMDDGPEPLGITQEENSNQQLISKMDQDISNDSDDDMEDDEFAQCYRRSLALTQRLKLSEKSLASMTRDNEDRILVLQNRVDDMTNQVNKQKRELLEYKTKEINSLEQISMLESHIDTIQQSKTDQKQVYLSIKTLFDEKCGETQKLQELLKQKELDLQKAEAFLSSFHHEFMQLTEERNRLESLQKDLERELATSHHTHTQLAEQRSENERLKQVIDSLKCDLDQARYEQRSSGYMDTSNLIESLEAELEGQLQLKENEVAKALEKIQQMQQTEERLKSAENEKNYYKSRATEAMEDLDRVKDELSHLKKVLESENRLLVTELADLQTKNKEGLTRPLSMDDFTTMDISTTIEPYIAALPINANKEEEKDNNNSNNDSTNKENVVKTQSGSRSINKNNRSVRFSQQLTDVWSQSRIRGRKLDMGKKREVFDLHNVTQNSTYSCIDMIY
ncbi:uncharacterized protein BX664DRAFT_8030 [Halteromyces radiatus]|uniref:uncharacterized protein n=1 Tax=Halteromyces radiatus TaxID=101107 RepID=UPI00221EFAD5|nr:uncharacterized protein BX664DRAFT_8030 [Halteromyces radiatus]KAI8098841.1 hypothetical protein BX664DRAFT_8030 [Halteromyces radiatus]